MYFSTLCSLSVHFGPRFYLQMKYFRFFSLRYVSWISISWSVFDPSLYEMPVWRRRSFRWTRKSLKTWSSADRMRWMRSPRRWLGRRKNVALLCRKSSLGLSNYTVWVKKSPLRPAVFWHFLQTVENFKSVFIHLLYVPIYARFQIFIQLSEILSKLCHIKRDYLVHIICSKCPPSAETHAFRRLRKSLIALLIVICGKSS